MKCRSPGGITIYNNSIYVCSIYRPIHVFTFDGILHLKTSIEVEVSYGIYVNNDFISDYNKNKIQC